jgi:PEP-CTERM motif-containing protein
VPGAQISIGGGEFHPIGPGDIDVISLGNVPPLPGGSGSISLQTPEPGMFALMLIGLLSLGFFLRARERR